MGAFVTRTSPWLGPCAPRSKTLFSGLLPTTVRVLRPLSLWWSSLSGEADTAPRRPITPSATTTTTSATKRRTDTLLLNTTSLYSSFLKRGRTTRRSTAPLANVAKYVGLQELAQLPRIPLLKPYENSG